MKNIPNGVMKWLAILLPPVSILTLCLVSIPRVMRLNEIRLERKKTEKSIQSYIEQIKEISSLPPDPKIASMPMTKEEQSNFLRGLSSLCYKTGNRIISVSSLAAPLPTPAVQGQNSTTASGANGTTPVSDIPKDVTEIKSTIIFEGTFSTIRSFLYGLENSRRLISMSNCSLAPGGGGYPTIQMTLTISRYVDNPQPAGGNPPPAPLTKS
jgi:hypothetical protein